MTALPDPNALLQMARSLAEAAAVLEVAAREAADERAARAVAEAARQEAESAAATAQIEAVCDGVETCGCDESRAWQGHVAILARKVTHLANNEEWLESEVARFSVRLCEEQGKALDMERNFRAAEVATMMARNNAQHWEREAARLAKELNAAQVAAATPETALESRPHAREFALVTIAESLGDRDIEGERWLQTITGAPFFLFDPHPDDFDIYVIAHALSNQCRFNGHTKRFYSVAEHSVLVMMILRDQGEPVSVQMAGLLHDAAEAYIGDMVRPLKVALPAYKAVEERIERALAERFDLQWPWPAAVKEADNIALAVEARDLLSRPPRPWRNLPEIPENLRLFVTDGRSYRESFLRWFGNLSAERQNGAARCDGPGACHGTMRWCDSCGDVGAVCDAVACDVHARPQRF